MKQQESGKNAGPRHMAKPHQQPTEDGNGQGCTDNDRIDKPPLAEDPKTVAKNTNYGKDKATILLIDDEAMIIEVGTRMLRKLGYEVVTADSGRSALKLFSEISRQIDLVICDLILPDIDGRVVLEQMKTLDSRVKVLLSSGYALDNQSQKLIDGNCLGFIQKPFNLTTLKTKVASALK